jgi:Papain family cysteine protease
VNDFRSIVGAVGPVSILMSAGDSFYNYKSGIYFDPTCSKDVNHAMLLVGYGTDPVGGAYWTVKNSWGEMSLAFEGCGLLLNLFFIRNKALSESPEIRTMFAT